MAGLKDKYEKYFRIGAAVSISTLAKHSDLIKTHFNYLTCENEMKYDSFCTEEGIYRFSWPDIINEFARKNNMLMHGHVFVWHEHTPEYIFTSNPTREQMLTCLQLHMKVVGNRYKELVNSWDVITEAIEDGQGAFYKENPFYRIIGEDYSDCIFRMAKEILPDKDLYYSDYNECFPGKQEKILKFVKGMRARGVPVDGISMQSHMNIYTPDIDTVKRAIDKYANSQFKLKITQLDVSLFRYEDTGRVEKPTTEMLKKQAKLYGELFRTYREYSEAIESVTFWGIADDKTWLDNFPVEGRKNWPLIFDVNGQPKEAFYEIMNF